LAHKPHRRVAGLLAAGGLEEGAEGTHGSYRRARRPWDGSQIGVDGPDREP
jgi:hypothetical protein